MDSNSDSSFVVKDSDEEEEEMESPIISYGRKNFLRKSQQPAGIILDSDEDELMKSYVDDKDHSSTDPMIREAIRRSILNISQNLTPSDNEENGNEDLQNSALESDEEIGNFRHHRKHHVLSGSSENFDSDNEKSTNSKPKPTQKARRAVILSDSEDDLIVKPGLNRKKKPNALADSSDEEVEMYKTKSTPKVNSNKSFSKHVDLHMSIADNMSITDNMDMSIGDNESKNESSRFDALMDESSDMEISEQPLKNQTPVKFSDAPVRRIPSFRKTLTPANSTLSRSEIIDDDDDDDSHTNGLMKKKSINESRASSNYIDDQSSSEDSMDIQEVSIIKKNTAVVDLDSDSSNNDSDFMDEAHATTLAKEELGGSMGLDHRTAQERVLLVCNIKKTEDELMKSKKFLESGPVDHLPDKGIKLRLNVADLEKKLIKLKSELKNIPLIKANTADDSIMIDSPVSRRKSEIFKREIVQPLPTFKKINKIKPEKNSSSDDDSNSDIHYSDDDPVIDGFLTNPRTDGVEKSLGRKAQETHDREQALTVETLKTFHGSLSTRPGPDVKAEDPRGLKISLMGHQKHALAWLLWREQQKPPGGVLADDMGLGKTLTMISLIMAANAAANDGDNSDDEWIGKKRGLRGGGTLIVCPASLINQWENEIKKRTRSGILSVEVYHGNKREASVARLARNDVVITTYDILSRAYKTQGTLFKIHWKRAILDEAHVIRNHKSQKCEGVCGIEAEKRWALTGTPIQNKEMDLYSILKFLKAEPFDDIRVWKRWVDNRNAAGHERLATLMKTLMLRRTKQELMADGSIESLPEKMSEIIWIKMDPEENLIYQKVMIYSKTLFAQFLTQKAEKNHAFEMGAGRYDAYSYRSTQFNKAQRALLASHAEVKTHEILVLLLRLRQVCCHPSLIEAMLDREDLEQSGMEEGMGLDADLLSQMNKIKIASSPTDNSNDEDDDGVVGVEDGVTQNILTSDNPVFNRDRQSSKLRAVLNLIDEIMEKDDKIIVVSQWTSVLKIVAESLDQMDGATYRFFSGQVAVKDRQAIIDDFNSESDPRILLLSLTAGGVGLNLVGGNHLILMDIHWNPQLESQAQDRIYRFGQKKNVYVYKVLIADSIEERIKALQDKKLAVADSVLSGGGRVASSKLTLNDLKDLFGL